MTIFNLLLVSALSLAGVVNLKDATTKKHAKGAQVYFLATPKLHNTKSAFMALLRIPPGGKVPEHRDPTEEYLYVTKGSGTIWIDDKPYRIEPGSAVFMPANAKVKFAADNDKKVEVVQFFAPTGPEKKYDSWGVKK